MKHSHNAVRMLVPRLCTLYIFGYEQRIARKWRVTASLCAWWNFSEREKSRCKINKSIFNDNRKRASWRGTFENWDLLFGLTVRFPVNARVLSDGVDSWLADNCYIMAATNHERRNIWVHVSWRITDLSIPRLYVLYAGGHAPVHLDNDE